MSKIALKPAAQARIVTKPRAVQQPHDVGIVSTMTTISCQHAPACSGCTAIAVPYEKQLQGKLATVQDLFIDAALTGFDAGSIKQITPSPQQDHYRNRARLAVRPIGDADRQAAGPPVALGLYKAGTHDLVDIPDCPVQTAGINRAVEVLRDAIHRCGVSIYDEQSHQGDLRYITVREGLRTGELLLGVITTREDFPGRDQLVEDVMAHCASAVGFVLNINPGKGNVIFGRTCQTLAGRDYLEELVRGVRIRLGLRSFFQINTAVAERAYEAIVKHLTSGRQQTSPDLTLLDLYCGVGTIGLVAAKVVAHVIGLEVVEEAVRLARDAADANDLANATFHQGLVQERLIELLSPEHGATAPPTELAAVVNPPRKGLGHTVVDQLIDIGPAQIAYLSCAPVALLRDLTRLTGGGYTIRHVELFDMFPQTDQVETLVILDRR